MIARYPRRRVYRFQGFCGYEPTNLRHEAVARRGSLHASLGDVRYAIHLLEGYVLELDRPEESVSWRSRNVILIAALDGFGLSQKPIQPQRDIRLVVFITVRPITQDRRA